MTRLLRMVAALGLALALVPAAASAAEPKTTLPDVEDEVMCVECGTVLNISTAPIADDQREFIQQRIDRGQSKEEIKAALVEEFGPDVLAMPDSDGFNVAVYAVPGALVALGLVGVALAARRWSRSSSDDGDDGDGGDGPAVDPAYERRLDAELASFDS